MKAFIALSTLVLLFVLTNCEITSPSDSLKMPETQWVDYKLKHKKEYDEEEDKTRFEIFKKALEMIEKHNEKYEKGETTFKMGLNHFSDLTDEERSKYTGGLRMPSSKASSEQQD